MAQLLIAGLSTRRPIFHPRRDHVFSVVEKVTVGEVFLRVLQSIPVGFMFIPSTTDAIFTASDSSL
jgi:hypothetical protein